MADLRDEIASDLSVFHRIDDADALDAPRYVRLAEFLPAYDGAVRSRLERVLREAQEERETVAPPRPKAKFQKAQEEVLTPSNTKVGAQVLAMKSEAGASRFPGFEYRK